MLLTIATLSLAAKANISAHDTTPLHWDSSLVFALSMTSNPRRLGLFAGESFSAVFEEVESMRTDPSQPWKDEGQVSNFLYFVEKNILNVLVNQTTAHFWILGATKVLFLCRLCQPNKYLGFTQEVQLCRK